MIEGLGLKKYYRVGSLFGRKKEIKAVDGVSLKIEEARTFGLVGESGCGKSTLGYLLVGLLEADEGIVKFYGKDISKLQKKEAKEVRRRMQIIFQDPSTSLNPRATVGATLLEAVSRRKELRKKERKDYVYWLLDVVGLGRREMDSFPHQLSGGQRQRVVIARAIAPAPSFIVCDEPTSSLDALVQAQILRLLLNIQKKLNISYLFISHDLSLISFLSKDVAIMHGGRILEQAQVEQILKRPLHPYTQALLSKNPLLFEEFPKRGCSFAPFCNRVAKECREGVPSLVEVESGHKVACFRI